MAEHLNTYQSAFRSAYILLNYLLVNLGHLVQIQFTGQYHHIGKLSVELECLDVAYVELG